MFFWKIPKNPKGIRNSPQVSNPNRKILNHSWESGRRENLADVKIWQTWKSGRRGNLADVKIWQTWKSGRRGNLADVKIAGFPYDMQSVLFGLL